MKKTNIILIALVVSAFTINAQEKNKSINNGFGFGFQLNQYQKDFGLGLNVTSPFFLNETLGIRLRANLMFNENFQNLEITWSPYANFALGLVGVSGMIGDFIRLYGEGGLLGILPSNQFSSEKFELGGYGLLGFEFFMSTFNNYFIEMGAVGTGARADKILSNPIYSNGFLMSTGFRFYLK